MSKALEMVLYMAQVSTLHAVTEFPVLRSYFQYQKTPQELTVHT